MRAFAVALVLVLAAGARQDEERTIVRSFSSELELSAESFELRGTEDGNSQDQEPPTYVREQAEELELVDTLRGDEDPPAEFTRLYRAVTTSFRVGVESAPREKTASAGLEGKSVTFEREQDGSYARSCDHADVRQGQLNRLRADVSLARFLPPAADESEEGDDDDQDDAGTEERDAGASWEIPCEVLARLISPAEETARRRNPKAPRPSGGLNLAPAALREPLVALYAACDGVITATDADAHDGDTDEEGADEEDDELPRHARLEFRLTSRFDGSEGLLGGFEAEADDELELSYEGTGTLAWDPEDGRIEIECQGELELRESFHVTVEGNGKTGEIEGKLVLRGRWTLAGEERRE